MEAIGPVEGNGETRAKVDMAQQDILKLQEWKDEVIAQLTGLQYTVSHLTMAFTDLRTEIRDRLKVEEQEEREFRQAKAEAWLGTLSHALGGGLAALIGAGLVYLVFHHP